MEKPIVYTWKELYAKAKKEGCDNMFLQIIKERPLYPREFTDHDVPEFGQKIKPNGKGSNNSWLLDFEFGYIMVYMHPSIEPKRERGWFETCFHSVDAWGNPTEYVVGLYPEEVDKI